MTATAAPRTDTNPFVGPRSLERGTELHGRDRETRDLLDLLVADRIVLCYSPSGAGKTSLINAGLTPRLEDEGFQVLPTIRLSHEPYEGAGNRYVASTLVSLGAVPADPAAGLKDGLSAVPVDEGKTGLLVFDQFEEVLSVAPFDVAEKRAFFDQLGRVLRERRWWVLFAMREDFLAALDPYLGLVPTRLASRFRLDLLGLEAAKEVITKTAASGGRTFTDDACVALVTELSRTAAGPGLYVEPVQLQVVCRRLWGTLPPDTTEVTPQVIGHVGNVDEALGGYYADEVEAVSKETGVAERLIRDWVGSELVTESGYRGQTQSGPSGDDRVVRLLEDAHLVRADSRRGTTWYELAHDRLVKPILENNDAWAAEHLSLFQQQAVLWEKENQRDDLVSADTILDEGEDLATSGEAMSDTERAFLKACRKARSAAERERASVRRTRQLLSAATIGLVIAVLTSAVAFWSYGDAGRARDRAEEGERFRLAAPAVDLEDFDPNLSAQLALKALERTDRAEGSAAQLAQEVLQHRITESARIGMTFPASGGGRLAFSPDGKHMATLGADGLSVWGTTKWVDPETEPLDPGAMTFSSGGDLVALDLGGEAVVVPASGELDYPDLPLGPGATRFKVVTVASGRGRIVAAAASRSDVTVAVSPWPIGEDENTTKPVTVRASAVRALALDPNAVQLATAASDGTIQLWGIAQPTGSATPIGALQAFNGHTGGVGRLVFSPDGKQLASGGDDGTVRVWTVGVDEPARIMATVDGAVTALAFSADGKWLAAGGTDSIARVIDRSTGQERLALGPVAGPVTDLAFTPKGDGLAVASDGAPAIWDISTKDPPGHRGSVYAVAFDPSGQRIATASADGTAALWDQSGKELAVLNGHEGEVNSVRFVAGGLVATASDDRTAKLWRADTAQEVRAFAGHQDSVYDVVATQDGSLLATASIDGTAKIWQVGSGAEIRTLDAGEELYGVAFSPDGRQLAATGESDTFLWDAGTGRLIKKLPHPDDSAGGRVSFSPDGHSLAASLADALVIWDAATGAVRRKFTIEASGLVPGVSFSPDGARVATGSGAIYELSTGRDVAHFEAGEGVAFDVAGKAIAIAGDVPAILDAATGQVKTFLGQRESLITTVEAAGAHNQLITGADDGSVSLRSPSGTVLARFAGAAGYVTDVQVSPDGNNVVAATGDSSATVWAKASGEARTLDDPAAASGDETRPAVEEAPAPRARFLDNKTVVLVPSSGGAWRWTLGSDRPAVAVIDHGKSVVGLSANGRWAAAFDGKRITIVDLRSAKRIATISGVTSPVSAAVSDDGRRLAVVTFDKEGGPTSRAGEVSTGSLQSIRQLAATDASSGGKPMFSSDGQLVASSGDGVVVWDFHTGKVIFQAAAGDEQSVAFASNRSLVVSNAGGLPVLVPLSLADLKAAARERVTRPLTDEECQKYLRTPAPCTPGAAPGPKESPND